MTLPAVWRMELRETRLEAVVQVRSVGLNEGVEGEVKRNVLKQHDQKIQSFSPLQND